MLENVEFESSVNSYGGQTMAISDRAERKFESSVNSYGGQTESFIEGGMTGV